MKKILISLIFLSIINGCASDRFLLESVSMNDSERSCLSVNGAIDIITVNGTEVNITGDKMFHASRKIYFPPGKYELGVKYHTGSGRYSCGIIPVSIDLTPGKKYKMVYYEEGGFVNFRFIEFTD